MRKILLTIAATLVSLPAFAGLTYEFRSTTEGAGGSNLIGTAAIEGTRMRMEIAEGDNVVFKNGSVVISSDMGSTMTILDPKEKTYTEFRVEEVFNALGSMMKSMGGMFKMTVENPSVQVRDAGDGGAIEGYPTRKYIIDSSYDMNMRVMGMSRKMNIKTETEAWTTDRFNQSFVSFVQQRGIKTGMPELDSLIDQQSKAMKGFPLKQVIRTTTTTGRKPQTTVTTMTISDIKEASVPDSRFEIPAGYTKTEAPVIPGFGGQ